MHRLGLQHEQLSLVSALPRVINLEACGAALDDRNRPGGMGMRPICVVDERGMERLDARESGRTEVGAAIGHIARLSTHRPRVRTPASHLQRLDSRALEDLDLLDRAARAEHDAGERVLREAVITSAELRDALEPLAVEILDSVKDALENTPPELAADLTRNGILLAGGGALLRGFRERVEAETGVPVALAQDPLTCVVLGAGRAIEEIEVLERAAI